MCERLKGTLLVAEDAKQEFNCVKDIDWDLCATVKTKEVYL